MRGVYPPVELLWWTGSIFVSAPLEMPRQESSLVILLVLPRWWEPFVPSPVPLSVGKWMDDARVTVSCKRHVDRVYGHAISYSQAFHE